MRNSQLTILVDRGTYHINGNAVAEGEDVNFAAGRVQLQQGEAPDSVRVLYYQGVSSTPTAESLIERSGEYHFSVEEGAVWFRERHARLLRLLEILNIPASILRQNQQMQKLIDAKKLEMWDWPRQPQAEVPNLRAYFHRGTSRPMIDHLFITYAVTEEDLARFLTGLLFGAAVGVDFFDALEEGGEKAHTWVKENLVLEVPHSHYGTPESRRTYLLVSDRHDPHHSIHESVLRPTGTEKTWQHARLLLELAERHGYRNVIEGNVLDMLGEKPHDAAEQLAYFEAWEDPQKAAELINRLTSVVAVDRRGKTIPHFLFYQPRLLAYADESTERELLPAKLGIPTTAASLIRYGSGEYVGPLFKRHGQALVDLLAAMIPHTRRISAPRMWRKYESMRPVSGVVYGRYSYQDPDRHQNVTVDEGVRPLAEMCELPASALRGHATCLTSAEKTELADDAFFAAFISDATRAHVLTGSEEAARNAVLWLPDGRTLPYLAVIKQKTRETTFHRVEHDVDLWAFTVTRDGDALIVNPYTPPQEYGIYYSSYSGFHVYDVVSREMMTLAHAS